jgi:LmbE family N-acetylglucosaminyl deacetylase
LRILGADGIYLDYLDCIYRLHPKTGEAMYASEEGIFGEIDPAESDLYRDLADRLAALLGPPRSAPHLHAPLTAGHHVDHLIARRAARELMQRGYRVDLYEDYPYARVADAHETALRSWSDGSPSPILVRLTPEAMEARLAAMAEYRSQIATLFGDEATMATETRAYCEGLSNDGCVERYWAVEQAPHAT